MRQLEQGMAVLYPEEEIIAFKYTGKSWEVRQIVHCSLWMLLSKRLMETSIVSAGIHGMDLSYVRQVMMGQYDCGNTNHRNTN
jgi:hypothetical protein